MTFSVSRAVLCWSFGAPHWHCIWFPREEQQTDADPVLGEGWEKKYWGEGYACAIEWMFYISLGMRMSFVLPRADGWTQMRYDWRSLGHCGFEWAGRSTPESRAWVNAPLPLKLVWVIDKQRLSSLQDPLSRTLTSNLQKHFLSHQVLVMVLWDWVPFW